MKVIKTLIGLVTLGVLMTAFAGTASASPITSYHYDNGLRGWVQQTLAWAAYGDTDGKKMPDPVEVRCYDSGLDFDRAYTYRTGASTSSSDGSRVVAFYDGRGNTIHVRTLTCSQAHRFTDEGIITPTTADAFATLLHEALHRQGIRNEHTTEQYALGAMYWAGYLAKGSDAGAWRVFDAAVAANHFTTLGTYHVGTPEAKLAKHNGWAFAY